MTSTIEPEQVLTLPEQASAPEPGSARTPRGGGLRPLLLRLHFYAGVLVAPFLLVAATTGFLYALTPQIDRVLYQHEQTVAHVGDTRLPLASQVSAALRAHPEGTLLGVLPADRPRDTTRVVLDVAGLGDKQRTVYVDPYSGQVRGALTTWYGSTPATTWLDDLHRNLHLGEAGRWYSELAASWMWVLVLGGLVLWVRRRRATRRLRRTLLPDLSVSGRRRSLSWHGATGVWISAGLLFLSVTGLTWSEHAGGHFSALLGAIHADAPQLDPTLATHPPAQLRAAATDGAAVDTVLAGARASGLSGPVEIDLPSDPASSAWTVTQTDGRWPVRLDSAAIDPVTGSATDHVRFADYNVFQKLSKYGIKAHMGLLFGWPNQVALAALALGLDVAVFFGFRSWWQRRPAGPTLRTGRPAPRGAWRALPWPLGLAVLAVAVFVGWALPLLGVSLALFLVIDVAVGLLRGRRDGSALAPGTRA